MEVRKFYRKQWFIPTSYQRIELESRMINQKKPNILKVLFTHPFYRVNKRKSLAGLDTINYGLQKAFMIFYHITMIVGSDPNQHKKVKICFFVLEVYEFGFQFSQQILKVQEAAWLLAGLGKMGKWDRRGSDEDDDGSDTEASGEEIIGEQDDTVTAEISAEDEEDGTDDDEDDDDANALGGVIIEIIKSLL